MRTVRHLLLALALALAAPRGAVASGLTLSGSVDTIAAWNANAPVDHVSFTPGYGVTGRRANELSLDLAALGVRMHPAPVGFQLILSTGSSADYVHSFEPAGSGVGPDVFRFLQQASLSYAAGDRLLLQAGVYPSHVGFETFPSQANWNATRSLLGDLSPYYQAGVMASYRFSDHLSGQLHLLNGWQTIGDTNDGKTVGTQVAWTSQLADVYVNGLAGPEQAGNDDHLRVLGDLVAVVRPVPALQVAASLDVAREQRLGADAGWEGVGLWARFAATDRLAFALRGEIFRDGDGAISGTPQTLKELTGTVELAPAPGLLLRLEGRHDRSSARVYGREDRFTDSQTLVLLQAVASFEEALP